MNCSRPALSRRTPVRRRFGSGPPEISTAPVRTVHVDAPLADESGDPYDDEAIKEKLRGLGYMH